MVRDVGKVVLIPDKYSVLVSDKGGVLNQGDVVEIYEIATDVIDPDTGDILGSYVFIKDHLVVTEVFQGFVKCQKYEDASSLAEFALTPLVESGYSKNVVPLRIDTEQSLELDITDPVIRIGDPARTYLE